jgi:LmbE family N-acetylglucosaminyl deacetylase
MLIREKARKALCALGDIPLDLLCYTGLLAESDEAGLWPRVIGKPSGSRVVVLAPHPDDDVIGCGGTLIKHHEAGDRITSIYLTDGRKGVPSHPEEEVVALRQEEARSAACVIGIDELVFLKHRDYELTGDSASAEELGRLLRGFRPDVIYLPHFLDLHRDHRATQGLFDLVCRREPLESVCLAYEAWSPLVPNRIVDISEQLETKCAAIAAHASQIAAIDYVHLFRGLAAYRSLLASSTLGKTGRTKEGKNREEREVRYAEAFFEFKACDFPRLYRRIQRGGRR